MTRTGLNFQPMAPRSGQQRLEAQAQTSSNRSYAESQSSIPRSGEVKVPVNEIRATRFT